MNHQNQCQRGHTILKPTCRSCRELRNDWDERLKSSGFEDIENVQALSLRGPSADLTGRTNFQTTETYQATVSYYQWARDKLHEERFASYRDKTIWENHAEGLSRNKIGAIVGLEGSWITRKLQKIETYLRTGSIASMSCQMALF